jgi:hypothetical protein
MCGGFIGDVLDSVTGAIGDVVDGVVNVVSDIGSSIDDMVHEIIPGGWAGVGALALLSVGIADPTLLGLADEGALTTEALTSAGVDATALATDVAAVTPEVTAATAAATSSGVAPEIIAAANATTDPIAALNALTGSTTADIGYLQSIGATPELIATAEANNAALAAGGAAAAGGATEGGAGTATGGATETGAGAGTTTAADGSTTQIFDDGSTLTTNADGTISATDINGNPTQTLVSPGGPGQAPVYDASGTAVPGTNNPLGAATDVPIGTALKDYAGAVYDSLGPLGTAGLLGGAALASGALTPTSNLGGPVGSGSVNYEWGQGIPLVNPGLNPGYIGPAASIPDYQTTSPTQAQYYWGVHTPVNTEADLANYNQLPAGAPETPWGLANSAVGGTQQFNVPNFVNQYITNPAWAGVNAGTTPGYTPEPAPVPVAATPVIGGGHPLTGNFQPQWLLAQNAAEQAPLSMAQLALQNQTGPAVPA